ncbi:MAG: phosphoribosylformylglycinamidine cyclo-ligase [Anaerolineae bacterium CG_4_9_14_3_um_filter_57_17]|nr:phosphoribosylformylglycinamidine cyclo-ligase [bacterium]NCT20264.1 phosphoribosylformylglycinamidine cyclo-ligase [bacterium]PJB64678.1 MAG: phosphoribosylformylglycinamidine cyclo-ligase [Anaerolineae bacterium CG_4_9_14_3_um_filter_57_17]
MTNTPGFVKTNFDDLTFLVNGLAMRTHNELKPGHKEIFYQRRLAELCQQEGLEVEVEKKVEVWVDESLIGYLYLDLWVQGCLVLECKAFSHLLTMDEVGQVLTYLTATSSPIGMLYNFGRSRLEQKRLFKPQIVSDWQKHLYRVIHKAPGMNLPPLPPANSDTPARKSSVPPIRFRVAEGRPFCVDIPSPGMAAIRLSASRQPSAPDSAYADSGVSIDAGNRAVELMKFAVRSTYTPAVLAGIGSFGGLLDASALKIMQNPVLVASTDGVGTKVKLAAQLGRYRGVGQDIVNHCIDDILVQGARPLFFMDYFATAQLIPEHTAEIVTGIAEACRAAGMVLLGGETAEMPGVYQPGEFDVAGTIVGVLERERILPRTAELRAGDALIGLRSSGPHTNGFSLIRKVFADSDLETVFPEWGVSLADALLAPHRSYLNILQSAIRDPHLKALAHLTGGGFIENIPRILPETLDARVHLGSWPLPPLWTLIQQKGGIATDEMYRVFNMGIGMVAVVDKNFAAEFQQLIPEPTFIIGELVSGAGKTLLV